MDILERAREVGAHAAPLGDGELNTARQALLREIAREENRAPAGHRRRWIGGSAVIGGLAAAAVVVGVVVNPAAAPVASAAEVLNRAAEATLTTTAITPGPGQYIRIEEIARYRLGWTAVDDDPNGGFWDSRSSTTEATVLLTRALYIPADRSGDWVRDYNSSLQVLDISGPQAETARPALLTAGPAAGLSVEVYPGGMFNEPELTLRGVYAPRHVDGLQCYYDEMPRDPAALAKWVDGYEWSQTESCPPPRFTEPDEFNLAPPDLRAAMLQALALTDGARVVGVDGDVTTIAFPEGGESDWMNTVDVDTATGLMVGRGNLDDDLWSSRVVVSIVDSIPSTVQVPVP
ncbi:hypothetical protein ASD65_00605 [Microbacterium sp. Root61]|uniref:hypothetical protein n=1 Tax=Microbacterium sp. Root61 TaxID=1736570 RepID=UPI0006F6CB3B|nr:hypothetical protein [Microbacterium sp. Root61]KRA23081.1 hypothetical protein ASD65_00605 [Microbacterium sp. Root61]